MYHCATDNIEFLVLSIVLIALWVQCNIYLLIIILHKTIIVYGRVDCIWR